MSGDVTARIPASGTTEKDSVIVYHVIFVDIVKYSARKPPIQQLVVQHLFSLIKNVVKALDLEQRVMYLPSGDGAAICIQLCPEMPAEALDFVSNLASVVQQWNDAELNKVESGVRTDFFSKWWSNETPAFALRMGVTVGPHFRYSDLNNRENLAGAAINQAARLLTLAGPNQVVFSQEAADLVKNATHDDLRFLRTMSSTIKGRSYFGFQLIGPSGINPMSFEPVIQEKQRDNGLDDLPHMWIRTNHSNPEIVWVSVDGDEWSRVTRMALEHYGTFISQPTEIERPGHAEGSDVYRVADREASRRPILLKIFRRERTDDELRRLCAVHREVANAGIFGNYGEYLRPLVTSAGHEWVLPGHEGARVAIAWYFLNEVKTGRVTHFKGGSEQEIESVAERLGQVNTVLIRSSLASLYPVHFPWNPDGWDATIQAVRSGDAIPSRTMYVARAEIALIERVRGEINALERADNYPITLNDFHPHNVFMSEGNCVLIFDYEGVRSDWPEVAACAFALHRFCREYVRRRARKDREIIVDPRTVARAAAEAFLRGYKKARPEIIDAVKAKGARWAKAVNFAKLMNVIDYGATRRADPSGRTEGQHFREVIKFISYLRELDVFESILSG